MTQKDIFLPTSSKLPCPQRASQFQVDFPSVLCNVLATMFVLGTQCPFQVLGSQAQFL